MHEFCVECGIVHQTTCPGTSQQNEVAECKHRHLLDARMLLFNMHVRKTYWVDVVLTANYLINRMPSPTLAHQSPFSLLHPNVKPCCLTPRVFGYIAFVHLLGPGRDKLSPRAIKCLFLRYSRTQKGY